MMASVVVPPDAESGVMPRLEQLHACPLCDGEETTWLFTAKDRLHATPGEYSYHRCSLCGTVFQNPRVVAEDLHLCYPRDYYTHHEKEAVGDVGGLPDQPSGGKANDAARSLGGFRDRLRFAIQQEVQGNRLGGVKGWVGRILAKSPRLRERAFHGLLPDEFLPRTPGFQKALEIGCGNGSRMLELGRLWDVEGVEWDPRSVEIARRKTGVRVFQGDFRSLDLPLGQYGMILLHHVFEHLDDPKNALQRIKELLAPNGRVVLVYPNPESLGASLFGDAWFPWEVPRHLALPPPRSLIRTARPIGFRLIKWKTSAFYAAGYFALSKNYRMGIQVDQFRLNVRAREKILEAVERWLIFFGMSVGEEATIVLQKCADE
jgi:SAM-dependent methyltransferase